MLNFNFYQIEIGKAEYTKEIEIKGEISNMSNRSYDTVAVRAVLFKRNAVVVNVIFMIHGMTAGSTKAFRKTIEDSDYGLLGKDINHYNIYVEATY